MPQLIPYFYINQFSYTVFTVVLIIVLSSKVILPFIVEKYIIRYIFILLY